MKGLLGASAFAALVAASHAVAATPSVPPEAIRELAPDGTLRAAINYGNPVLAQRNPALGAPHGVSADLARELARQLGVPVAFVIYNEAGEVSAAARQHAWDVAFLAVDPVRAADIAFTPPYVVIEGTYLVPAGSALRSIEDVDTDGIRIGVAKGSAYDLYLRRGLKHAQLVSLADTAAATEAFRTGQVDALAGVKEPLVALAASHPQWRLIPGRFMEIDQAMGLPAGRPAALRVVRQFVEAMKASGFVGNALRDSGQATAVVAPAESSP